MAYHPDNFANLCCALARMAAVGALIFIVIVCFGEYFFPTG